MIPIPRSARCGGRFDARPAQSNVAGRIILVAVLLLMSALPGLSDEQTITVVVRPGQSEADVGRALDFAAKAGMPVRLELSKDAASSSTEVGKQPVMPMTPEMVATNIGMHSWESVTAAIWRGATVAWSGLWAVTAMMSMTKASLSAEGSDVGDALLATGASMVVGAFVVSLVQLFLRRASRKRIEVAEVGLFRVACCRLAVDLLSIALFFVFARFALQHLLVPSGIAHQVSRCVLAMVMVSLVYVAVARLLFTPSVGRTTLLNIENPSWHFKMLVLHGVITAIVTETIRLAYVLGMNPGAIDGWFLIGNTVLTLQKLIWFFVGSAGIRSVFIGRDAGILRRVAGNLLPEFYIGATVLIWLAGFLVAGTPESTRWSFAAGTTQVILLAAPIFALGSVVLFDETVGRAAQSLEHRWWSAVLASMRLLLSAGAWIACLHLIVALWTPLMVGDAEVLASWISWLERSSLAVVISWAVCTLILRYFDCVAPVLEIFIPGQDDDHGRKAASRFSTALPVAKNLAMGAVLALAGLLTLKSAGLDVAPLLAGFGVVGLALSFGSQALVRDVVSGIFFIADDAFRIGEYIETGALRGTVEQITLRSVRLRHHNGPVHTITFCQINSVTNLSRDWGTIKLELGFDRDVDIDMIRKVAKKVGLDMLSDPEFGADFILPLKMQGIQDLTETSIVIRFKFTSRPGNPGLIKREAMKRLIFAFRERGLPFASNSVTVRSNGQDGTSADLELAAAASLRPTTALAI